MKQQTKVQLERYERYCRYVQRHGCRSLYMHYGTYSSTKASAWQRIAARCNEENGFALTMVSGGPHFFSTGYLRYVEDNVELVYDTKGYVDRIPLTNEQRQELSKILCRTI